MNMSNEEIVRHYRQAKDRDDDITVLADLNGTTRDAICAVLAEAGETLPVKRKRRSRKNGEATLSDLIAPLYEQGLTDYEIARQLNCSVQSVRNWRCRNGHRSMNGGDKRKERKPVKKSEDRPASDIYALVDTILGAVPLDTSEVTRRQAVQLCLSLLEDNISRRLGLKPDGGEGGAE